MVNANALNAGVNKSTFTPSRYQQKIFDFVINGEGNVVINAVAGSGKTTTIVEAVKLIPIGFSSCFVAFNKSIVEELRKRIPLSTDVSTMHSIGLAAIKKHFNLAKIGKDFVDGRKYNNYAKKLSKSWNVETDTEEEKNMSEYIKKIVRIADLARFNLILEADEMVPICTNNGIVAFSCDIDRALDLIDLSIHDTSKIDFIDMIVMPAFYEMELPNKYDWIFVDECQDLNRAQQYLLSKLLTPRGRFVAVGDPRQAIYGFAGADTDSFNRLRTSSDTIELPLSISYRCSKEVVKFAQKLVPELLPNDTAPDGEVNEKGKMEHILDGDFVLCRNGFPLVQCCLQFLSKGRKVSIIGSDIGKSLIDLIDRTLETDVEKMINMLKRMRQNIIDKLINKGFDWNEAIEHERVTAFDEKYAMIKVISQSGKYERVLQVINKIEEIFGEEEKSGITFATIHKAKGLEAERVHIICRELMPSPKAKKDWEIQQETNLMYVAYTRAKILLSFVIDFEIKPLSD